jgi:GNAT superfamily N-acetyltransferase
VLSVLPLTQVPHLKPLVNAWLVSEWPQRYGPGGPGNLAPDVEAFAKSATELPVGFIVLNRNQPIGFGALKAESIASHTHLSPWAAAGYVRPENRGQGTGAVLLEAIVAHARSLGFPHVYCGTSTAINLLRRAGWQEHESIIHSGKPLIIFRSGA